MSDARGISVLAICGSLRAGSYNRAALRTAIELKPPGMTIETAEIGSIPLYNEDVRAQGFPPPVETLRRQIAAADALLFVTPEYNYSIPGVLKNAIDWASRPPDQPFAGKPVAIMGAGAGMAGTARAQYDLRRCCVFLDMHPLNKPEVLIGVAHTKFDAEGGFTDEAGRGFIRDLLVALEQWTRLIGRKA
jgi:chromate reductase, NAD(P)H dehydrogenase (quinone)